MNIAKHIQDLLYRYECIIVPGFGAFLSQKQPAFIEHKTNTFHPPKKVVSFNRQLLKNDGLLANYIAEAEQLSYNNAVYKINEFVASLEKSLEDDKKAELENIGEFTFSAEKTLQFEPCTEINYLTDSFGLESFQSEVVQREVYKKQVQELEEKTPFLFTPEKRKSPSYLKYAAIGLLALGLTGYAGLNIYSNQVSEHNIAEQQEAENQLQQQIQQATFIIDNPLPAVTLEVEKQSGDYHIVAGAFRMPENAEKKVDELKAEGYKARLIGENRYGLHQVVYASLQTRREAINMLREVKKTNEGAWLLVEEL
ncbi:SPOR domain-containing protein [Zunongwangia sp. F363]|uniref:SPOR domain-containing protein n=1 Tax=Autumnicola tepida TaxID=3075595 RepID=A0ABU3C777_9FLAO|nr:SPOR domain-containing protein [Zunongwangia sp. F363]MDT0642133.1 SPOR domain-containing protein [Zunongwangia sp. F363]